MSGNLGRPRALKGGGLICGTDWSIKVAPTLTAAAYFAHSFVKSSLPDLFSFCINSYMPATGNAEQPQHEEAFSQNNLNDALSGLSYISESEAPVELVCWPSAKNQAGLQAAVAQKLSIPETEQQVLKPDDFLTAIHRMAGPGDQAMQAWSRQWDRLFALLGENGRELVIIRGGKITVHYVIAAFGANEAIVLHTTSVET